MNSNVIVMKDAYLGDDMKEKVSIWKIANGFHDMVDIVYEVVCIIEFYRLTYQELW